MHKTELSAIILYLTEDKIKWLVICKSTAANCLEKECLENLHENFLTGSWMLGEDEGEIVHVRKKFFLRYMMHPSFVV